MAPPITTVLRRHWLLAGLTVLSGLALLAFGVRFTVAYIYWSDPAHRFQQVEAWMTPGYVARSWGVERDHFMEQLDLQRGEGRLSLSELASRKGRDVPSYLRSVEEAARKLGRAGDQSGSKQ
ncbi:MAG: hypothetical protein KDJ73_10705 [Notoacmeibacter sp.]|nr:hypothetical protein [Notoacmeibacter sp.]MCC0032941.1 hypothetical protein [Brucellaceae bacterium]